MGEQLAAPTGRTDSGQRSGTGNRPHSPAERSAVGGQKRRRRSVAAAVGVRLVGWGAVFWWAQV
ncbi:hypothetical protein [Saccharothrix carnea]|uniref:hypothetical protein n=1 Tax=Saccharothrix carnea TaxID=1280637 RepID=UPI000D0D4F83|nr:hypothetical protein [Saccharothrix carnea]